MKTGFRKKSIAMLLCVVMVASMLPISAVAADLSGAVAEGTAVAPVEEIVSETVEISAEEMVEEPVEESAEELIEELAEEPTEAESVAKNVTEAIPETALIVPGEGDGVEEGIPECVGRDAASTVDSGTCGDDLTWSLDENGVLTISGTGAMTDYDPYVDAEAPWYSNRSSVFSVVIESGVTSIGAGAFYGCSSLTSVSISDSVTSIEYCAFDGCSSLTDVYLTDIEAWLLIAFGDHTANPLGANSKKKQLYLNGGLISELVIPEGVTSIGDGAFCYCSGLTSVSIPAGVTSIGIGAFEGCSNLTSVSIPEGVTSIASHTFRACSSLASVSIPEGVTSIGECAFSGCSSLTSVSIPEGVTSIDADAFRGCSGLTNVSIPGSLTSIGYCTFYGCSGLTSVSIPEGVTTIGMCAFWYCSSLTSVSIPASVTSIDQGAFYYCSNLTSFTVSSENTMYADMDGVLFNKSCTELIIYPNGKAGDYNISDGVTSIGSNAFYDCGNLTSVIIPDSVTSIGGRAFCFCSSLTSITIPNSVTSIGDSAFFVQNSTEITVYVPDKDELSAAVSGYDWEGSNRVVTYASIKSYTGNWDENLTWTVEDGVMTLAGTGAMADFGYYEDENGEPAYRESPWKDCFADVTKIIISEGITSVGEEAFVGWAIMTSESKTSYNRNQIELVLPDSLTSVASSAFFGTNLDTVHIGSGLEEIPYLYDWAFSGVGYYIISEDNPNYTAVDGVLYSKDGTSLLQIPRNAQLAAIPATVTSLGEGSLGSWALEEIVIPDTVTSIGSNTISGNYTVTDVTFGSGVAAIPGSCLAWCPSLKTVTIPLEITAIGACAFEMVESLTDVYYEGTKAQWEAVSLGEGNTSLMLSSVTIHCSDGAYEYESLASGVCGDGLTWELSPEGVLTISGTGAMKDYGEVLDENSEVAGEYIYISAPWPQEYVTSVVLEDGVTSIGSSAFAGCVNLESVTIPDTVTSIGGSAFFFPEGGVLGDIYFNGTETQWTAITIGTDNEALSTATLHCQTLYSAESGIQISAENELAEGVTLAVESVNEEDVGANVLVQLGDVTCAAYNISLLDSNGAETQPNGSIEIRIPVPAGLDGVKCVVYRAEEDGTLTDMQAEYIDGCMVFTTEHLSLYLLAQPKLLLGDVNEDGEVTIADAVRIARYDAGYVELTESQMAAADTNGDGEVTIADAVRIARYDAGYIDVL